VVYLCLDCASLFQSTEWLRVCLVVLVGCTAGVGGMYSCIKGQQVSVVPDLVCISRHCLCSLLEEMRRGAMHAGISEARGASM
jgi:hypothetical protein